MRFERAGDLRKCFWEGNSKGLLAAFHLLAQFLEFVLTILAAYISIKFSVVDSTSQFAKSRVYFPFITYNL